jgi:hypothetical protein
MVGVISRIQRIAAGGLGELHHLIMQNSNTIHPFKYLVKSRETLYVNRYSLVVTRGGEH